ncbi:hypothetical protein GCM10011357_07460 [Lacimicrobium alkaliphilum]|uniref:Uncharacterized protein n=1 Tax=Lacimicrobium alkaliphilum TaxID=1526571 RepID=A0ABQ1R529_9ALTE|nr:hypothetical protein GCM10011357_07460 [Lacimicrobium alkaliphilum]
MLSLLKGLHGPDIGDTFDTATFKHEIAKLGWHSEFLAGLRTDNLFITLDQVVKNHQQEAAKNGFFLLV